MVHPVHGADVTGSAIDDAAKLLRPLVGSGIFGNNKIFPTMLTQGLRLEITMEEARGPMGLRKDLHIKALTEDPVIRERWHGVHGRYPGREDVDRMFSDFVPRQLESRNQIPESKLQKPESIINIFML